MAIQSEVRSIKIDFFISFFPFSFPNSPNLYDSGSLGFLEFLSI